nr:MFS transporter [uncultured Duganella sp.]
MTQDTPMMEAIVEHPNIKTTARRVVTLGALIILLDGFDTQAIGFAATALARDLGIPMSQMGIVFSAGLVGALLGAFILSPLADRFGRKPIIQLSIAVFGLFTLFTALATSLEMLCALRLLAGIGLGAAIPNVISHCIEFVPPRRRGVVVGLLYAGFPVGGMIGAGISAVVLPMFGWKSIFIIGGLLPLALLPVFHWLAPESLQYLASSPRRAARLRSLIQQLAPDFPLNFKADVQTAAKRSAASEVFATGGLLGNALLWIPFFMILLMLIIMVLWTPSLLEKSGMGASHAVLVVGLINLGSALGNILAGRTIDRYGPFVVIPCVVMVGAFCLAPMGLLTELPWVLAAAAIGSGFFVGASAAGMMALSSAWYPVHVRATGFGWAYSVGRLGQLVGPLIPGYLLTQGLSVSHIFPLMAVPASIAAVAIILLRQLPHARSVDRQRHQDLTVPAVH